MVSWTKQKYMSSSRRDFITQLSAVVPSVAAGSIDNFAEKPMFVHHVYFWLKNSDSKEDKARLLEGLSHLSKVSSIKMFQIGVPAATNRDVIDRSYAVSWLAIFDDQLSQDSYQKDPIHLKFVDDCSSLWSKVIVYDSVDA
jgi:stress responsive alpha/beta barrel protein